VQPCCTRRTAEFAYDALARRIKVRDAVADTNNIYYYNDKWQVLCDYNDSGAGGTAERWFAYGNYIDEPVLMSENFTTVLLLKHFVQDHLYSTVALISGTGISVAERYEYDAYGNCRIMDGWYIPRSTSNYGNPYLFTGRRIDILDNGSLKLQYNRNRYYDQYTGRWFTHDPLGITPNASWPNRFDARGQYKGSLSLYEVVGSNPASKVDPSGLLRITPPDLGLGIGFPANPLAGICSLINRACCDKCVAGSRTFGVEKVWIVPNGRTPDEIRAVSIIDKVITWGSVPRFKLPYFDPVASGCAISSVSSLITKLHLGNNIQTLQQMYLSIREYKCVKRRCVWGLLIKKRYNWKKGKKYDHECKVGDPDKWQGPPIDAYETRDDAEASIKDCIDDFEDGFEFNASSASEAVFLANECQD